MGQRGLRIRRALVAWRPCSFVVRYRVNGRLRRFTIGPFPRVSLADARQTAGDVLREAQGGKDLAAEKIEARRAETFAELADEYIERHASGVDGRTSGC
jgi:Arm domain-containing DNA-binding protein